jgi:hypothetical protein
MNISRIKFVVLFLLFAVGFLLVSTIILEQEPETMFGSRSTEVWKSTVATVFSPIKMILVGPLVPFINFLHQDPDTPPPFFLLGFAFYWTLLGLALHFILSKFKHAH